MWSYDFVSEWNFRSCINAYEVVQSTRRLLAFLRQHIATNYSSCQFSFFQNSNYSPQRHQCSDLLRIAEQYSIRQVGELRADALDAVAAVAGDPVRWPLDAHQTLDIEMQHIARSGMLVAVGWQLWLDVADAVQFQPSQDAAYRGVAQTELLRDPDPGPTSSS